MQRVQPFCSLLHHKLKMPYQNNLKLPGKVLKKLEDKITKRITSNIGNLVEKKCRAGVKKFGVVTIGKTTDKKSDLESLRALPSSIRNKVRELIKKVGYTIIQVEVKLCYLASD